MDNQLAAIVSSHLKALGNGHVEPLNPKFDINQELMARFEVTILPEAYFNWPGYSGHRQYPIRHPLYRCPAKAALETDDLWTGNGLNNKQYVKSRRAACMYLSTKQGFYIDHRIQYKNEI